MFYFRQLRRRFYRYFPVLLLAAIIPGSCSASPPQSEFAMGTICQLNLFEKGNHDLYSRVFARLRELEAILSANMEGSDLDNVNKNAGFMPVKVRPELIEVLEKALEYAEKSNGHFDPSIGPLVKLWGIGTDKERIPTGEEILEALKLIDYSQIVINKAEETVFLGRGGMKLDLGGIAKGYAADEAAKLLTGEGLKRAIIDLGGNIIGMGERKGKTGSDETWWRIGIQDPRTDRGNYIGILKVKNKSVVTSGNYERFFEEGGKRYHHIFSIESGYPAGNGILSVTIAADNSIDADALSTAAFTLGWEQGSELIASVKGAIGIFVFDDLSVRVTEDAEDIFTLTAAEYHIVNFERP